MVQFQLFILSSLKLLLLKECTIFKLFLIFMVKKSLQEVIKQNKEFGFDRSLIEIAYARVDGDANRVLDQIFKIQQQSSQFPTKPSNVIDQDAQLNKAIEQSINEARGKKISLEPLNPQQRVRKSGVPVGLKNIGNTCYFNSLLQTYFKNGNFVKVVLNYQTPAKYKVVEKKGKEGQQDFELKRKQASCRLVQNMKELFAKMICSDRKYIDPTDVISSIVDDYGNELTIGDQKDIGQFNMVFLSRVEQGLSLARQDNAMDIQKSCEDNPLEKSASKIKIIGQQINQTSLLKRTSIIVNEKSLIAKQFFGKMEYSLHNQKENINIVEEQLFNLLFLDVKHRDLYRACQQVVISQIDDYRNQKGEIVGVQKQSWIKQAPRNLFFQINRVIFDKQKCALQKINTLFEFPPIFYLDPFLLKNKVKALQIQKTVRKLRDEREKYSDALKQLQNFGKNGFNLFSIIQDTTTFLQKQNNQMQVERQIDNPIYFSSVNSNKNTQVIALLTTYKNTIQRRIQEYHQKIEHIDKQISNQYERINSTPYYLYSILIHEGSAQMGHYYSYTLDLETNTWRKYNDININEEVQAQVMKEAKGLNYTSAYYLVYGQKQALVPSGLKVPLHSKKLSNEQGYMQDYYSQFLPEDLNNKVKIDNNQLYYDIQQYKMGSFVTRVVDSYTKKFQFCNQIFRKQKPQKKKTTPPLLVNLPLFAKVAFNDDQYKNSLIENCINDFGPKEYNPVFQDLLKKKLNNFNEFKKPKSLSGRADLITNYLANVYRAVAAKHLFWSLRDSQYFGIFSLLQQLISAEKGDYFEWLGGLISKILLVRFLLDAEQNVGQKSEFGMQRLKLLVLILFKYINLDEEKTLINNCIFWISQVAIDMKQPYKGQAQKIADLINKRQYKGEFSELLENKVNQSIISDIKGSIQINDALFNMARKQNTFITDMIAARQQVKGKMQISNQLYREFKKFNVPLKKAERDKFKQSK